MLFIVDILGEFRLKKGTVLAIMLKISANMRILTRLSKLCCMFLLIERVDWVKCYSEAVKSNLVGESVNNSV